MSTPGSNPGITLKKRDVLILMAVVLSPLILTFLSIATNKSGIMEWFKGVGFYYVEALALLGGTVYVWCCKLQKIRRYLWCLLAVLGAVIIIFMICHNSFQYFIGYEMTQNTTGVTFINNTDSPKVSTDWTIFPSNNWLYDGRNIIGSYIHSVLFDGRIQGLFGAFLGILSALTVLCGTSLNYNKRTERLLSIIAILAIVIAVMFFALQQGAAYVVPLRHIYISVIATVLPTLMLCLGILAAESSENTNAIICAEQKSNLIKERNVALIISLIVAFGIGFVFGELSLYFIRELATHVTGATIVFNGIQTYIVYMGGFFLIVASFVFIASLVKMIFRTTNDLTKIFNL